jgi:hypothetical protein
MLGIGLNGHGSPISLSMDYLAYLLGYRQMHSALADCQTQNKVMSHMYAAVNQQD